MQSERPEETILVCIKSYALCLEARSQADFPISISKVTQDTKHLITLLAAQPAPWSEVAGSYELNFGRLGTQPTSQTSKRGLFDDIKNGIEGVGKAITGSADIDPSVSFDTTAGTPGKVTNIFTDPL